MQIAKVQLSAAYYRDTLVKKAERRAFLRKTRASFVSSIMSVASIIHRGAFSRLVAVGRMDGDFGNSGDSEEIISTRKVASRMGSKNGKGGRRKDAVKHI